MENNQKLRTYIRKYIDLGFYLIPVRGKRPIEKNWPQKGSNDFDTVMSWFKDPTVNVGVITGKISGIFGFDADKKNNGLETLKGLISKNGLLPQTLLGFTGGGGRHFIFFYDPSIKNWDNCMDGIDIKSDGGCLILPPSIHPDTKVQYEWENINAKILEAPDWLKKIVSKKVSGSSTQSVNPNAEISEGGRHHHLVSLAGTMRRRGMDQDSIAAALLTENRNHCNPPLDEPEVIGIAKSIERYAPSEEVLSFLFTDSSNAERFAKSESGNIFYIPAWKKWFFWNGKYWQIDTTGFVFEKFKLVARPLRESGNNIADSKIRNLYLKSLAKLDSLKTMRDSITLAQNYLSKEISELDSHSFEINLQNGIFDLKKSTFMEHNRNKFHTKIANFSFDSNADCPAFRSFLSQIMNGDTEMIDYIQMVVGYAMTGDTSEHSIFMLHGTGANGKSTFVETIKSLLGTYAMSADINSFLEQPYTSIRNDIARLRGARFVTASEPAQSKKLDESLVKQLTGEDTLTARFLYGENFEFNPNCKIMLTVNHKPKISSVGNGMWRRIRLLPFEVTIPQDKMKKDLADILRSELAGIFNWGAEGCRKWLTIKNLKGPSKVESAGIEYLHEQDPLHDFFESCCIINIEAVVKGTLFYREYRDWCTANGERYMEKGEFNEIMKQRFGVKKGSFRGWKGIGLKSDKNDKEPNF